MITEDLIWAVNTQSCTHDISQNCTLETYIILLTNVTQTNLILKSK